MTDTATTQVDPAKVEAFGERMMNLLNEAALSLMISIGHRTHLFDTMATMDPATSDEIAERAGLHERYVREWLGAMTTGRIVEHDPESGTYHLPAEHAALLTRAASPDNIAIETLFMSVLGGVEDEIVDCFHNGGGVPYSSFTRFHEVMAEESAQTVVSSLHSCILPLVDGLNGRLEDGIEVMDLGCGSGRALIAMAAEYRRSHFTGYDLSEEAIARAASEARQRGLTNVTFEARDVTHLGLSGRFDLITAFDAIHDQARPDAVLAGIREALKPDGVFLMQDIKASSHLHQNLGHPLGPFLYTISTMHCMTVSLAQEGGMGLGTCWGCEKAETMLKEAGFSDVRIKELEHDIINCYYIATKS